MEPRDSITRCPHCGRPLTVDDCWEVATEDGAVLFCSYCRKDISIESCESPGAAKLVRQCHHKLHPDEAEDDENAFVAWSSEAEVCHSRELAVA